MTGKEIIYKAFNHEPTPRVPWVPYTGIHVGSLAGYDAESLLLDAGKLIQCLLVAHNTYAPDGMPVVFDLQVEAEILGCKLKWDKKAPPTVMDHPLAQNRDFSHLSVPQRWQGRIPLILSTMQILKKSVGDTTALYGLICGPFTLASHLRGMDIFMDMFDDPEYLKSLLAFTTDVARSMADFYIDAGMDIIGVVDPLISQIGPEMFEDFFSEPYKEIFNYIRRRKAFSSFFVCGDATKNIEGMCKTEPDCLSIDENINMIEAKKITDKYNKVISGNMNLTTVLLLGTQQDCQKLAIDLLDSMGNTNFILAPGCDMPYDVPSKNLIGIAQAVQNVSATRKLLEGYTKTSLNIEVSLPDYGNLDNPLIEVYTIDSDTCAACRYMRLAAEDIKQYFGDRVKIDVFELKITEPVNIAKAQKLGLANLPALLINGKLKYSSVIPNRKELIEEIEALVGKK